MAKTIGPLHSDEAWGSFGEITFRRGANATVAHRRKYKKTPRDSWIYGRYLGAARKGWFGDTRVDLLFLWTRLGDERVRQYGIFRTNRHQLVENPEHFTFDQAMRIRNANDVDRYFSTYIRKSKWFSQFQRIRIRHLNETGRSLTLMVRMPNNPRNAYNQITTQIMTHVSDLSYVAVGDVPIITSLTIGDAEYEKALQTIVEIP